MKTLRPQPAPEEPEPAELPDFFVEYMNTPFDFNEYVQTEAELINGGPFDLTTEDGYQIYLETVQAVVDDYNATRGAAISQVAVYRMERASFFTDEVMSDPDIIEFMSLLEQFEQIITGDTLYCYDLYTMPLTGNSFDMTLQNQWNLFRTEYGFDGRIKNRNQNGDEYPEGTLPRYCYPASRMVYGRELGGFLRGICKSEYTGTDSSCRR